MTQLITRKQLDETLDMIMDVLLGSDDAELAVMYDGSGYAQYGKVPVIIRRIRQLLAQAE